MQALMTKPSLMSDLSSMIVDDDEDLEKQPFQVDSLEKAHWASSRYLDAERRILERSQLADHYVRKVYEWQDKANKPDQDSLGYFRMLLQPWVQDRLMGIRSRSLSLPGIRLGLRKKPDRVEVVNPIVALEFCEAQVPDAVVVKKDLSKTELKKALCFGKEIPGVQLVYGDDELSIKED